MTTIDSAERFKGFCLAYDKFRPPPPFEIIDIAIKMSKKEMPEMVVDLGCGTGLSTRPWAKHAKQIIGIEPSNEMLSVALSHGSNHKILYKQGFGNDTGLMSDSTDIVTASSAIHWMEPKTTAIEISRILRKQGVLIIYGHYYPVFAESYELTLLHEEWRRNLDKLEFDLEMQQAIKYPLFQIIDSFKESRFFQYYRKLYIHSKVNWNKEQIIGFLNAHAGVQYLKDKGYSKEQLMLAHYEKKLDPFPNSSHFTTYFTYSIDIFIK